MALVLDTRDVETRQWLEAIGRPEVVIDLRDSPAPVEEPDESRSEAVRFFAAGVVCCGLVVLSRRVVLRRRRHR
jgi:hypothetical protein